MSRILIVDDEPHVQSLMRRLLTRAGYEVIVASTGTEALRAAQTHCPDAVVVDWMMPGMDGLELTRRLRTLNGPPVLLLSARDDTADRVLGLDSGAEDYIVKPFDPEEMLARVRVVLRRATGGTSGHVLIHGDLSLNTQTHEVVRAGRSIVLTPREFDLLTLLLRQPGHVLRRESMITQVWGHGYEGTDANLDTHIGTLRAKLEASGEHRLIQTIRGIGFTLRESVPGLSEHTIGL
jgi:two-component system, OmpR family, response regulator MprA